MREQLWMIGKHAPAFSLPCSDGTTVSLDILKGKTVVLYFYPKDNTPGCAIEAQEFSVLLSRFQKKNAVVYGVSRDTIKSHKAFASECTLKVPLLSDENSVLCKKYDVLEHKQFMGKPYIGIKRTTVVIDGKGVIRKRYDAVNPNGHAARVLAEL
jgi:thioredoxin-dependent peroxiredoxin